MEKCLLIRDIYAREILDPEGNPSVEVEILAGDFVTGKSAVPLWNCRETGSEIQEKPLRELIRIRHAAENAAEYVNSSLAHVLIGKNVFCQQEIDGILSGEERGCNREGTGISSAFAVSAAAAAAAAAALQLPLYRYLGGIKVKKVPVPMVELTGDPQTVPLPKLYAVMCGESPLYEKLALCKRMDSVLEERKRPGADADFETNGKWSRSALKKMLADAVSAAECKAGISPADVIFAVKKSFCEEHVCQEVKPCQTQTLTELFRIVSSLRENGRKVLFAGGTAGAGNAEMADIAVAAGADYFSAGRIRGTENTEKYNRLLMIEEQIGKTGCCERHFGLHNN